jgi:DNA-binding GntR family transcriptional regulator
VGKNPNISLTDQAYSRIEELIVTLQLPPGGAVSEGELCAQTGFGRTPVREALMRLSQQRLINILPRRGMFVTEINVETQLYLLELRREVEPLMAGLAARRRTDEERFAFGEIASAMEAAARDYDEEAFLALDKAFNELVGRACRNPFAQATMDQWNPLARRFWYQHHQKAGDLARMATLHANVAWAIGGGEDVAAAEACDALIDYLTGFTRAALDADHG